MGTRNGNGGSVATKRIKVPPVELSNKETEAESCAEIQARLGISARKAYEIIHFYAKAGKLRHMKVRSTNVFGDACVKHVYWIQE